MKKLIISVFVLMLIGCSHKSTERSQQSDVIPSIHWQQAQILLDQVLSRSKNLSKIEMKQIELN